MAVSVTIDNLNAGVFDWLQVEARRRGVDVKDVIKEIIEDRLVPLANRSVDQTYHDLDDLAGTWSAEEAAAFLSATADMRRCDEDLWK